MTLDLAFALPSQAPFPARLLVEVPLRPVQGARFQPTGFPDLGAAVFDTKDGSHVLVESAQSMANRLETVCWNPAADDLVPELKGLSYVRVTKKDGRFLTSTVLEAHRLNSAYVEKGDAKFHARLAEEIALEDGAPIDRKKLVATIARYDVGALLHGIFLESIDGRLRLPRALGAFIEAEGIGVASSGGVKNDHVKPGTDDGERTAAEGFGNVPFQRDEYTAEKITAFFSLDLAQIRGYGLGAHAERLLVALALFKIQSFLSSGLRLRTACDLEPAGAIRVTRPEGAAIPSLESLAKAMPALISECKPLFGGENGVTTVQFGA